jgi:hypothetical protein
VEVLFKSFQMHSITHYDCYAQLKQAAAVSYFNKTINKINYRPEQTNVYKLQLYNTSRVTTHLYFTCAAQLWRVARAAKCPNTSTSTAPTKVAPYSRSLGSKLRPKDRLPSVLPSLPSPPSNHRTNNTKLPPAISAPLHVIYKLQFTNGPVDRFWHTVWRHIQLTQLTN